MRLIDVLKLSGIPSGYLQTYFLDAQLVGNVILVPDRVIANAVVKNFGDALEMAFPGMTVKVGTVPRVGKPSTGAPSYLNAAGVKAWKLKQATQERLPD